MQSIHSCQSKVYDSLYKREVPGDPGPISRRDKKYSEIEFRQSLCKTSRGPDKKISLISE